MTEPILEVKQIRDFLSPEECHTLIADAKECEEKRTGIQNDLVPEWKNVSSFELSDDLADRVGAIHKRIGETILSEYGVEKFKAREDGYFYRYGMGDFYRPHCDALTVGERDGIVVGLRKPTSADVSSILYLNDDFIGGELEFGFRGERVKPETGKLVLFYGGWQNTHCVHPIEMGHRYCIVNWFITEPNLVPIAEAIPSPYAESFAAWEKEYQQVKNG